MLKDILVVDLLETHVSIVERTLNIVRMFLHTKKPVKLDQQWYQQ
jgi:hypothetical protein